MSSALLVWFTIVVGLSHVHYGSCSEVTLLLEGPTYPSQNSRIIPHPGMHTDLHNQRDFSYSIWVHPTQYPTGADPLCIFERVHTSSGSHSPSFYLESDGRILVKHTLESGTDAEYHSRVGIALNRWTHVHFVSDHYSSPYSAQIFFNSLNAGPVEPCPGGSQPATFSSTHFMFCGPTPPFQGRVAALHFHSESDRSTYVIVKNMLQRHPEDAGGRMIASQSYIRTTLVQPDPHKAIPSFRDATEYCVMFRTYRKVSCSQFSWNSRYNIFMRTTAASMSNGSPLTMLAAYLERAGSNCYLSIEISTRDSSNGQVSTHYKRTSLQIMQSFTSYAVCVSHSLRRVDAWCEGVYSGSADTLTWPSTDTAVMPATSTEEMQIWLASPNDANGNTLATWPNQAVEIKQLTWWDTYVEPYNL